MPPRIWKGGYGKKSERKIYAQGSKRPNSKSTYPPEHPVGEKKKI